MDQTKITLSEQEHRLMMDPSVILTKNKVIEKVYELFGHSSRISLSMFTLPPEVAIILPKIARGEAYKGLPYIMLDYPRYFTSNDVLAIRTFFWWGNYISVTLHLKGAYVSLFSRSLLRHYRKLADDGFVLETSSDEWDHDLKGDGYTPLSAIGSKRLEEHLLKAPFVKIACSFSLETWNNMPDQLLRAYESFGAVIDLKGE